GNMAAAEKELRSVVAAAPDNVDANFDLGRAFAKSRNYEQAVKRFERVLQLRPDYTQAHYQLFLAYSRDKRPELAKAELEKFHLLEDMDKAVRKVQNQLNKSRQLAAQSENSP